MPAAAGMPPATGGLRRRDAEDEYEVEQPAHKDERLAASPARRHVVADRAHCWLYQDRHDRGAKLEHAHRCPPRCCTHEALDLLLADIS